MQPLRSEYAGKLDKNEVRQSRYGCLDLFREDTSLMDGILDDETKALIKRSFGNSVQVPVLTKDNISISNVRSCTVNDSESTSHIVTLTFATYSFGFTMYPSQYFNNDVKYQADFNHKLKQRLLALAAALDTACYTKLNNDRNAYFPAAITAFYPVVSNALQVSQAQRNDFYNQLETIMQVMDFYDTINIASSTSGKPMVSRLNAQGEGNSINEAFQLTGYDWKYSNRIPNGSGIQSTLFALQKGTVAIMSRNSPDALAAHKSTNGTEWGVVKAPIVDMDMDYQYRSLCTDANALTSGTAGLTSTMKEEFQWSVDVCLMSAYNSNAAAQYNPILKVEISAT